MSVHVRRNTQFKPDGSPYQEGEIVPFMLDNPFFEFAYDENLQEIVGFRLGFGEAMGILSGDIETLTGNVNVQILDVGAAMADAVQENPSFGDQVIKAITPLLEAGNPLSSKAQLVKGDPNDPDVGALDPIRAEYIGVPDGEVFVLDGASGFARWAMKYILAPGSTSEIRTPGCNSTLDCPGGSIEIVAKDCIVLAIYSCFDLGIYNSFAVGEIGEVNGKRAVTSPVSGAFMSFQTKALDWLENVKKTNPDSADYIQATAGAFFNIPNGATEVNLSEALYGVQRYRTEYIDRGKGLF
ncbi:hypothetical protein [Marinobacter salexigens]|uniref:hypothetical protein n=1 Tax=Marinobacter salexigens TaxID=1925763 RepID=UPI000C288B94|nr:hypothetical protein [Marinobacter salexigens]